MVDYRAKFVLAPMVRIGELPTRLLALKYGADLVWSPEIIDKKIIQCERVANPALNTIDFLAISGNKKIPGLTDLVFRTHTALEANKIIFQMGTSNPQLAVKAAKMIIGDVAGIDINSGCPKHFSIHAGMGAALMSTPDLLCEILHSLVEEVGKPNNKPISVKIRLFKEKEESLKLIKRLVDTGISNLTVHCRTKDMRNRETPIREYISDIKQICVDKGIGFIMNGGVKSYAEYKELQKQYGNDVSCMVASEAELNPSVFRKEGILGWPIVSKDYIELADQLNNHKANSKYCVMRMIPNPGGRNKIYNMIKGMKEHEGLYDTLINKMDDEGNYIEDKDTSNYKENEESEQQASSKKRKGEEIFEKIDIAINDVQKKKRIEA